MLKPELNALVDLAANGNHEASVFLRGWFYYCHGIDDVIDGHVPEGELKEKIIGLFLYAKDLYSTPFYRRNIDMLSGVVDAVVNAYADSVAWELSEEPWQQEQSRLLCSQGIDILIVVAKICGGYELMRSVSVKIRELSQQEQRG